MVADKFTGRRCVDKLSSSWTLPPPPPAFFKVRPPQAASKKPYSSLCHAFKFGTLRLTSSMQAARITYLSNTLIKRIGNIFEEALANDPASTETTSQNGAPSHTTTAMQQFQLDVESTALVRAAEEIMVLTRSMKDVWLFGGLDTLTTNHNGEHADGAQPEDIRTVAGYIQKRLGSEEPEVIPQPAEVQENGS
jgi:hypothetical protein